VVKRFRPDFLAPAGAAFAFLLIASTLSDMGRAQDAGAGAGKELFDRRCGGCHALDRDKEGPRLRGIYKRTAASVDSFLYSDALKKSKVVWTDETLDRWLADPEKLVPNNDMSFHVDKSEERRAIISYLKQNSGE